MPNHLLPFVAIAVAMTLSSVPTVAAPAKNLKPESVCYVEDSSYARHCIPGDKMLIAPTSWGNEQYPLRLITDFCDINKPIHFSQAGVVCVKNAGIKMYRGEHIAQEIDIRNDFQSIKSDPQWTKIDRNQYVRVINKGTGPVVGAKDFNYNYQSYYGGLETHLDNMGKNYMGKLRLGDQFEYFDFNPTAPRESVRATITLESFSN